MNLKKLSIFFHRNLNYLIILAVALFIFAASFGTSLLETLKLLNMKNELKKEIAQGQEESSQLDEEIAQIGTQGYIEYTARKYLELYYPDEQIVIPVENSMKEQAQKNQKNKQGKQEDSYSEETESDDESLTTAEPAEEELDLAEEETSTEEDITAEEDEAATQDEETGSENAQQESYEGTE